MFRFLVILGSVSVVACAQQVAERLREGGPVPPGAPGATSTLPDTTAAGALALLPKEAAARVARVEGPDGHPFPERWYVLVHDPAFPTGLREYVIADGKAVANRALSQFADRVSAEEVIGAACVKINSPVAAGIAAQFTMHNGQLLGSIRYELFKLDGVPVWRLTCATSGGQLLGTLVLHATTGSVLSSDGFTSSPPQSGVASASQSDETESELADSNAPIAAKPRVPTRSSKPAPKRRVQSASRKKSSPGPIDRVGSFFRKVFR